MFSEYVGAFLVIEHAAEPVTVTRRREPRRYACLAHDVYLCSFFDQQFEKRVPSAVGGTEKRVLIECRNSTRANSQFEEELDRCERLLLSHGAFADPVIKRCCG